MSKRAKFCLFALFALSALLVSGAVNAIPNSINYQARLRDNSGDPIIVSTTIQFSIYNHLSNGAPGDTPDESGPLLWTETYDQASGACVQVSPDANGYFTLTLGDCVAFPDYLDFSTGTYYLGVKIGADSEAGPRVKLNSHPYALNSHRVDGLHATTTATAGQILALGDDLSFNIGTGTYSGASINLTSSTATSTISGNLSVIGNATFATATIANLVITNPVNLTNFTFGSATGTNLSLDTLTVTGTSTLGIINSGTWQGSIIGVAYGGTGQNTSGWNGFTKLINGVWTTSTIALASDASGILPIVNGGTNASSFTASQFLWFNGTSIVASGYDNSDFMTAGTDNWVDTAGDTMSGALTINNNLTVTGTSIFEYVGIGTTTPVATLDVYGDMILSGPGRYINFGSAMSGTGYGFRDSSGTMQFKNETGDWNNFSTKINHIINVAKEGGDYSELAPAIDAANASPYDVVINIYPGVYDVSSTLFVTSTRIKSIRGMSKEAVVIHPTADLVASPGPIFDIGFVADSDFGLRLMTIDGSETPGFKTTAGCTAVSISAGGSHWMDVSEIIIKDVNIGISMEVANLLNVIHVDIYRVGDTAFKVDNGASMAVMSSYVEDVDGKYAWIRSSFGATTFYMVNSEFGSLSSLGAGIYIQDDDSYAELRNSNLWGLNYNIQSQDDSEVLVTAGFLQRAASFNIEQKDTSKISVVNSSGDFSSTDINIQNPANVYFSVFSIDEKSLLVGSHDYVDQNIFMVDRGSLAGNELRFSYKNNYYSDYGLIYRNPNVGENNIFAVESNNGRAGLAAVSSDRNMSVSLSLITDTSGDIGASTSSVRGWKLNNFGDDSVLLFQFMNNDTGDSKPVVDATLLTMDGFNSQIIVNGGAVFNTSSGAYDFQVKGAADPNLLFANGNTDNVGIGTSTPSEKLVVEGNLFVTGDASSTYFYASTGTFDNLTKLSVFSTSTLSGPVLLGDYLKFTTVGDNNIYFSDNDGIYLKWDNGAARFMLSEGIDVDGMVSSTALMVDGNATTTGNANFGGVVSVGTDVDTSTQLSVYASGGRDLLKIIGSSYAGLFIDQTGKVMVGTTTILDGDMLEVVGSDLSSGPTSSKNYITMTAIGNGESGLYVRRIDSGSYDNGWSWYIPTSSLDLRLYDDTILDDVMSIRAGGNIGIGTTTPEYILTVVSTSSMRDILPESDLVYSLGSLSQRWLNVFANTGTFSNLSVSNPAHFTSLTFDNATGTNMYLSGGGLFDHLTVTNTSTLTGPTLLGSYLQFTTAGNNFIYFNNTTTDYLKWDATLNRFDLSGALNVLGIVTSTGLAVNGTANVTDLAVGNSITLGGISRSTWPAGGGGGGSGFWATTTANVGYVTLDNPYAIVIGSSATTSNSIFEVQGNSKFIGDLTITGGATSTNFYAANIGWNTASGTALTFGSATGTNFSLSGLANLNGALKVGDTSSTVTGAIKFSGNDFLGYDGAYWRSLTNVAVVRGEATGFPNITDSAVSFVDGTRTFAIAPVGANFDFYYQGAKFTKTTGQTTVIDNTEGLWYVYFNSSGVLQCSQTQPDEKTSVNVAMLYWDATNGKAIMLGEYRSGLIMDEATHQWIRETVGPRYSSGLTLSANVAGDGTDNKDAQVALTGGVIFDEDLKYTIVSTGSPAVPFEQDLGVGSGSTITTPAKIPLYYRSGAAGVERKKTATSYPVYENTGSRLSYNPYSAGWTISTVPDGNYVAVWLFATHNIYEPIVAVLGQRVDADLADARLNNTYSSLTLDSLPYQNMKVLYRIIYKTDDTYTNSVKAKIVDTQDYRDVTTLPSGNYVASAHGALTGLNQDDHSQYLLMAGRSDGQTVYGGIEAGGNLTLDSTGHANKGSIFIQPAGGIVVIGSSSTSSPNVSLLSLQGNSTVSSLLNIASSSGASYLRVNNDGNIGIGTTTPGYALTVVSTASMRDILPESDLAYSLGSAVRRWNNVYANTGTFANLSVTNPTHFTSLTFDNATGTNMYLSGGATLDHLTVINTSTLSGPVLLGSYMQYATVGNNFLYFNNTTTNYLEWASSTGQFVMSNGLSVNGTVSSTGLVVNSNSTTTGNVYIGGTLNVIGATTQSTSTVANLIVTNIASTSQLIVTNTSTLSGPALFGSYMQFTTAGDNNIFFNNTSSQYLKWNNAANRFDLSNALNVAGTITSTGLYVNGTASVTDLLVGSSITLGGVSRTTWPTGGGGGGDSVWSTTSARVAYPNLASPYAIVIGSSVTSSNVIFEVVGDTKLGGNVTITGNATSTNFYATNLNWATASGTSLVWTSATGTNLVWINATGTNFSFTNASGTALRWANATGTNLNISNLLSVSQLSVANTSTLTGAVRMGSYAQFTTAGNNFLYFNNVTGTYLQWDNANSRFAFSHGLSVSGTASSTALIVNGNATTTGNFYVGGQLTVIATSTFSTTSINSLLLADGTASSPSLAFINDRSVGLYHPAGDGLAFSTSGTEKMRILSNGNVGIGTTTPGMKLTVYNGDIEVTSGTARMIMGSGAFPNHALDTDSSGLTTNANGVVKSGLVTEVNGALLSFAINASQLGDRNTSTIGAIFRLDTRVNTPYWSLKRQAVGGSTEYSDFQISTEGDMGIGAGHASDANSFAGQLHILPKNSTTTALVLQGTAGQSADLTQWRDFSNNILGSANILSANFGLSMDAGAFISRNSYMGEEFSRYNVTTRVSDTVGSAAYNALSGYGDGRGWGVYEGGGGSDCSFSMLSDTVNGVFRMANNSANSGCLSMLDEGANNAYLIANAANLPVILMKVRPSAVGANNQVFVGLSDTTDGQTTDPSNFIGFTNNGGTTWTGRTASGGGTTNVTCTGATISTASFALLKVEVRSSTMVRFFVDANVSDGVDFTECTTGSASNIPAGNLAPELMYQVRTGGTAARNLDVDFFRMWQDDAADSGNVLVLDQPVEELPPELSAEERLALLETNDTTFQITLDQYKVSLDDNISAVSALANSANALNVSLSDTQAMLSALTNRVYSLESAASSTAGTLVDLNTAMTDISTRLAVLASSTVGIDFSTGIYGDLSANALIVNSLSVFNGPISAKQHVAFGEDTVGQAMILAGHSSTTISFTLPYETLPIISVTPVDYDGKWKLTEVATSGFKIEIGELSILNLLFNWQTFGAQPESKVFVSDGTTTTIGLQIIYTPSVVPEESVVEPPTEEPPVAEPPVVEPPATDPPAAEPPIIPDNPVIEPPAEEPVADTGTPSAETPPSTPSPDGLDESAPPAEPVAGETAPEAAEEGVPAE